MERVESSILKGLTTCVLFMDPKKRDEIRVRVLLTDLEITFITMVGFKLSSQRNNFLKLG